MGHDLPLLSTERNGQHGSRAVLEHVVAPTRPIGCNGSFRTTERAGAAVDSRHSAKSRYLARADYLERQTLIQINVHGRHALTNARKAEFAKGSGLMRGMVPSLLAMLSLAIVVVAPVQSRPAPGSSSPRHR
jgi:hypothetical protein